MIDFNILPQNSTLLLTSKRNFCLEVKAASLPDEHKYLDKIKPEKNALRF
jgi:hypothetical protein